jgi:hypothetical protein
MDLKGPAPSVLFVDLRAHEYMGLRARPLGPGFLWGETDGGSIGVCLSKAEILAKKG